MNEEYYDNRFKVGKIIGKVLKYIAIGLIVLVYALFMLRICTSGPPANMKLFIWNKTAVSAYQSEPQSFAVTGQKATATITDDGKFSIDNIKYVKSLGQIQATIRYNNSTVKSLAEDYSLSQAPEGEPFVYVLTDNNGNRYTSYEFTRGNRTVYNYRHLIFDNVNLSEDVTKIYIDIFYINDVNFSQPPYGSLIIYDSEVYTEEYSMKKELPDTVQSLQPEEKLYSSPSYLTKGE